MDYENFKDDYIWVDQRRLTFKNNTMFISKKYIISLYKKIKEAENKSPQPAED